MKSLVALHSVNEFCQVKIYECTNYSDIGYHWELWQSNEKIADSYDNEPVDNSVEALNDALAVYHNFIED